jgi:hypothetical protein
MADAAARPQVVANIIPNQWSTRHLDITVQNTGNATAFDIEVHFNPPLTNGEARDSETRVPFQRVSILKPGQALASYLSDVGEYLKKSFRVTITWKVEPQSASRQSLVYDLNMADFQGVSYLGSRDPLVQVADQLKKLREDWRYVASGSRKIKADTYSSEDRREEREFLDQQYERSDDSDHEAGVDQQSQSRIRISAIRRLRRFKDLALKLFRPLSGR